MMRENMTPSLPPSHSSPSMLSSPLTVASQQFKSRCPYCGALLREGEKCDDLFGKLLSLEYGDPEYGAVHLFSVDCYALQHSEDHSPRSNAFHLLRLYLILYCGSSSAIGFQDRRLGRLVRQKYRDFPDLKAPDDRGSFNVADVLEATNPQEHRRRVELWALAVWRAYGVHYKWVEETEGEP
jgi:hypothetical protein